MFIREMNTGNIITYSIHNKPIVLNTILLIQIYYFKVDYITYKK
jgi:hypothetical protein